MKKQINALINRGLCSLLITCVATLGLCYVLAAAAQRVVSPDDKEGDVPWFAGDLLQHLITELIAIGLIATCIVELISEVVVACIRNAAMKKTDAELEEQSQKQLGTWCGTMIGSSFIGTAAGIGAYLWYISAVCIQQVPMYQNTSLQIMCLDDPIFNSSTGYASTISPDIKDAYATVPWIMALGILAVLGLSTNLSAFFGVAAKPHQPSKGTAPARCFSYSPRP